MYVVTLAPSSRVSLVYDCEPLMWLVHSLPLTPGEILNAKLAALRVPLKSSGKSVSAAAVREVPSVEESVARRADSAETSTESVTAPTSNRTSARSVPATLTSRLLRTSFLKPLASNVIVYGPAGRLGTEYWPVSLLTAA